MLFRFTLSNAVGYKLTQCKSVTFLFLRIPNDILISFNVDIPVDKIILPLNLDIYFNISVVNISPDGILTIGILIFELNISNYQYQS